MFWVLLVSVIIRVIVRPFIFKVKWLSSNIYSIVILVTAIAGVLLFGDLMPEIQMPMWIELFLTGGYLLWHYGRKIYKNYRKHGSIKSCEEVSKVSFWGKVNEGIEDDLPKIHKKRFEKKNRRLAKKNKPLISEEEYMKDYRREVKLDKIGSLVGIFIIIIGGLSVVVVDIIHSAIVESILFLLIYTLIEIPIIKWLWSGYKKNPRENVLKKCEELGMSIVEYAKALEDGTIKR